MGYITNIIRNESCLVIKIEDVVMNPEIELQKIMSYINLDIHDEQKDFINETSIETRGSTYSNFRKNDEALYAWKNQIKGKERQMVESYLYEELKFFNYS